jgi:hypothetical protein
MFRVLFSKTKGEQSFAGTEDNRAGIKFKVNFVAQASSLLFSGRQDACATDGRRSAGHLRAGSPRPRTQII